MFCDKVEIVVRAGNGGNGHLSFLHEKYREFGGPDGGDGGEGGNIIFRVSPSWNTLYYYKTHRKMTAQNGDEGKGRKKHGRNGDDLYVEVPLGTSVYNAETGAILADLDIPEAEAVIAKGGEGGYGNSHFSSSVRQAPKFAELGTKGEEFTLRLELKLVADVAFVGLPNIGKSTLLSVISAAKPKIADYEFTTLVPNLGVVDGFGTSGFVCADLPGLIAGAAQGKGLGDEFLRHIERTRVVVHLLDGTSETIEKDYEIINKEIEEFNAEILNKPQVLVVSKIDLIDEKAKKSVQKKAEKIIKKYKHMLAVTKPFLISSITHEGIRELVLEISSVVENIPKLTGKNKPKKVFTLADAKTTSHAVTREEAEAFRVTGPRLEKFALKTDFSNPHAVARIYDIMTRTGVIKRMDKLGAHVGDKIRILDHEIDYKG